MCIWPQQVWDRGISTVQPSRSSSATVALPTSGNSPSTRQVTNKATRTLGPPGSLGCPVPSQDRATLPDVTRPPVAGDGAGHLERPGGRGAQHQHAAVVLGRPLPPPRPGHEGRPLPGLPPQPLVEPGDPGAVGQRPQLVLPLDDPPHLPHHQRGPPPPPPVGPGRPPPPHARPAPPPPRAPAPVPTPSPSPVRRSPPPVLSTRGTTAPCATTWSSSPTASTCTPPRVCS